MHAFSDQLCSKFAAGMMLQLIDCNANNAYTHAWDHWILSLMCSAALIAGADGKHNNTGAQADLWCGPTATSKISVKHFFSGLQSNGVRSEVRA